MTFTVPAKIKESVRSSRVRQCWEKGKPAFCTTIHFTDPAVCEVASGLGFDCLWIDLEHHATSVESASQMIRAARAGGVADVMARPAKGEFMRMGRLLEAGAHGILYPRCDNADEAREVVRWAKFAPLGERGFDGGNADNGYCAYAADGYVAESNVQTWLAIQIESPAAVPHARAIAETEGVDVVFFGPGDFSLLDGRPGDVKGAATLRAAEEVAKETLAAGKRFGTLVFDADHARRCLDMGATLVCWESDLTHLRARWMEQLATIRNLVEA